MSLNLVHESDLESDPEFHAWQASPNREKGGAQFMSIINDDNKFLRRITVPTPDSFQFAVEGVIFHISTHIDPAHPQESHVTVWASLGYLPYSATSQKARHLLIQILTSARGLQHAKFGVDRTCQIMVTDQFTVSSADVFSGLFPPLMRFMGQALPFIRLIGDCL